LGPRTHSCCWTLTAKSRAARLRTFKAVACADPAGGGGQMEGTGHRRPVKIWGQNLASLATGSKSGHQVYALEAMARVSCVSPPRRAGPER